MAEGGWDLTSTAGSPGFLLLLLVQWLGSGQVGGSASPPDQVARVRAAAGGGGWSDADRGGCQLG
jgi:hypothetical protein